MYLSSHQSSRPEYLNMYLSSHQSSRLEYLKMFKYASLISQQLIVPKTKLNLGKHALSVAAPGSGMNSPSL